MLNIEEAIIENVKNLNDLGELQEKVYASLDKHWKLIEDTVRCYQKALQQIATGDFPFDAGDAETWAKEVLNNPECVNWQDYDQEVEQGNHEVDDMLVLLGQIGPDEEEADEEPDDGYFNEDEKEGMF